MGASLTGLDAGLRDAARSLDGVVHASRLRGSFTSTFRTDAEQTRLYRRFLAGLSEFPAVPPGASAHQYGLAFDYVIEPFSLQPELGALWKSWGGAWSAADSVHFELPGASAAAYNYWKTVLGGVEVLTTKAPWWVDLAAGLPIALWPTIVFSLLGIPSAVKKTATPEQEEFLRSIALSLPH